MIPWMTLSQSSTALRAQAPGDVVAACFAAVAAHLLLLAMVWVTTAPALHKDRLSVADRKACVIMGAQKSLPVAVAVLVGLNIGPVTGLATVPLVIAHLFQTIFDSFFAIHWHAATLPSVDDDASVGSAASAHSAQALVGLSAETARANGESPAGTTLVPEP